MAMYKCYECGWAKIKTKSEVIECIHPIGCRPLDGVSHWISTKELEEQREQKRLELKDW